MKYGPRNQLMGEVTNIKEGAVMCEVKLKIVSGDAFVLFSFFEAPFLGLLKMPGPVY